MAMRRNCFDYITRILHFKDNLQIDFDDKYSKLRPLISNLQKKFMLHFVPGQHISHDEAMVKYFGKHSSKQAFRNKSIRFDYKLWCQNNPFDYLVSFDPYQGKTFEGNVEEEEKFGKCSATILHLLRNYSSDKIDLPMFSIVTTCFRLFLLAHELLQRDYKSVGTIGQNRMGKICPLKDVKTVSKKNCGAYDSARANFKGKEIFVTRWKDNAVFTLASSLYGVELLGIKKRWN